MAEDTDKEVESVESDPILEEKSNKKKLLIFVAIGVIILLATGGGILFFVGGMGDESKDHSQVTATETEESEEKLAEEKDSEKKDSSSETPGEEKKQSLQDKLNAKDDSEEDNEFGRTFTFKSFQGNLGNPLENRYIRLDVALEYRGGEEQKSELEKRRPQLRDAILSIVTVKTREFLLAPDGKDQLRKEILIRINRYMTKPIDAVFLTDMLIE